MRPSKYGEEQVKQALLQVRDGTPLVAMCRQMGITQTTFYRWRRKYDGTGTNGGTNQSETRLLRDENHMLKQLVADLVLERQALRASLTKQSKSVRHARD